MIKRLQTIKNILTNNMTSTADPHCCPISGRAYNAAMEQLTHIIEEMQLQEKQDKQKKEVWEIIQAAPPILFPLDEWRERIDIVDSTTLESILNDFVQERRMIKYCFGNDIRYGKTSVYPSGGCCANI